MPPQETRPSHRFSSVFLSTQGHFVYRNPEVHSVLTSGMVIVLGKAGNLWMNGALGMDEDWCWCLDPQANHFLVCRSRVHGSLRKPNFRVYERKTQFALYPVSQMMSWRTFEI
jgi:hypothetical protein